MDYRKFLLPCRAKFIGLALAIAGACGLFLCDLFFVNFFSYIILTAGLLLVAVSREKDEDEYITFIRMRAIFYMAVICVLYTVLSPVVDYVAVHSCSLGTRSNISLFSYGVSRLPSILFLYIVLFRLSLMQTMPKEYAE